VKDSKDESQKVYWESVRKRREPSHPVVQAFVEPKIRYIDKIIGKNKKNYTLLDIGCGNGFFSYYFEKMYDTFALDFAGIMLQNNLCEKKILGSATQLPFGENSFDITFCSNLLHHLNAPKEAVSEMKRVSRKYVVLSEPNRNNPFMFIFGLLNKMEWGTLKFSLKYMEKLIDDARLILISSSNMGIILPNKTPIFLSPFLKKLDGEFPLAFYNILIAEKLL